MEQPTPLALLQKYFGYKAFRPLQPEIITTVLQKQDSFVLMPTGGGKSLCYQLPALLLDGLTLVISPLIALMKDQVDGLRANGIKAAFLNSSLTPAESRQVVQQAMRNEIKILYLAPERIMTPNFLPLLDQLKISLVAIDEAHCISEWGHDFRPEYRQLKIFKEKFPYLPIIALTATAIPAVQRDIIDHLKLNQPKCFQASFNRENLHYQVLSKSDHAYDEVLAFLQNHKQDSGIIYCQSRRTTENLANSLRAEGYRALPYHAGLENGLRAETQEKFIRDNCDIIVATIAFGMGIDKPNVRYVIHFDLPRNLESYYQETGRAGRDGLKSDCILFYGFQDRRIIEHFIKQKTDPKEQQIAYEKLGQIIRYCKSAICRRKVLLNYFGEAYTAANCGACDVCTAKQETIDATIAAQKFLSTVARLKQPFGMNYIIGILTGVANKRILENGHQHLSTYGIGMEFSRNQWQVLAHQLIEQGLLAQDSGQYPVLRLTPASREVLFNQKSVTVSMPSEKPIFSLAQEQDYDSRLFQELRDLRKILADKKSVPPYIIFSDAALKEMASKYPQSAEEFINISGVGQSKLRSFGTVFINKIRSYCQSHGVREPANYHYKARPADRKKGATYMETFELLKKGLSLAAIAQQRSLTIATVTRHLEALILAGEGISITHLVPKDRQSQIIRAIRDRGPSSLSRLKEVLGDDFSWEEIRLVRAVYWMTSGVDKGAQPDSWQD